MMWLEVAILFDFGVRMNPERGIVSVPSVRSRNYMCVCVDVCVCVCVEQSTCCGRITGVALVVRQAKTRQRGRSGESLRRTTPGQAAVRFVLRESSW